MNAENKENFVKIRSPKHLEFVRQQQCLITNGIYQCSGAPVVAHHLTFLGGQGRGTKECDSKTVSLCHSHHMNLHNIGEKSFWTMWGIDAEQEARNLAMLSPDSRISELYTVIE
jgi:hypothetical protein